MAASLIRSGLSKEWIKKYLQSTSTLPSLLRYYKDLDDILTSLGVGYMENGASCKSKVVDLTLSNIFNGGENGILKRARSFGGGHFVDLLWAAGLAEEILDSKEEITLIVPIDQSFETLSASMQEKLKNKCYLKTVLKYHIVKGRKDKVLMKNNHAMKSQQNSEPVYYNKYGEISTLSGSIVVDWDNEAVGGLIHLVNEIMIPPVNTVLKELSSLPTYSIFYKHLSQPLIQKEIRDKGPCTYFVPSNEAFNNSYELTDLNGNQLSIRRYVVCGLYFTGDWVSQSDTKLTSLNGHMVTINESVNKFRANDNEISSDVFARDGIIYFIKETF